MSEKKRHEVMIGGTGGQGVITIAYVLAQAASKVYSNVTRFPIYLATLRGGAAYCTVIFSDEEISAPILSHFENAITMESGSYSRFKGGVKEGGVLVVNSSIVNKLDDKPNFRQYPVPVIELAQDMGAPKMANMVMLGAYRQITGALDDELVIEAMGKILAADDKKDRLNLSLEAYQVGAKYAREQWFK